MNKRQCMLMIKTPWLQEDILSATPGAGESAGNEYAGVSEETSIVANTAPLSAASARTIEGYPQQASRAGGYLPVRNATRDRR